MKAKVTRVKLPSKGELAALTVIDWCKKHGHPLPKPEYLFAGGIERKWRFDLAWPLLAFPLAVEINGGGWVEGRHNRGSSLEDEYEKLATAAALGFRVMIATHKMLERGDVWPLLEMALSVK